MSAFLSSWAVARRDGDADARPDHHLVAVDVVGLPDVVDEALGEDRGRFRLVDAGLQDRELVAAEAGDGIGVAHAGEEALGHRLEEAIADRMAERVVDALEVVEVEAEHGDSPRATRTSAFSISSRKSTRFA